MEKSAIVQIQESANIPELIEQVSRKATKDALVLAPENFKLLNLESYMPNRSNYRARISTNSIPDFIEYCKEFDKVGAQCFVNSVEMSACSILDMGTQNAPLHQEHQAYIRLVKTSPFESLTHIDGATLSQKSISDFIEDWSDFLVIKDSSGVVMANGIAATKLRDLTIERASEINSKVDDFSEHMSAMEKIEAKGSEALPAFLFFTCTPYSGLSERTFNLRLSVLTGEAKPRVSVRVVKGELAKEEMAEEFKDLICDGFINSEVTTYLGCFK